LQNRAALDPKLAAVRLFQKEHIKYVERRTPPVYKFTVFAVSAEINAKQTCLQGVLEGPRFITSQSRRPTNSLVEQQAICEATPDSVAQFLTERQNDKWNPSALFHILYALEHLGFKPQKITQAFERLDLTFSKLIGQLTAYE
jgi:hypothetical protein